MERLSRSAELTLLSVACLTIMVGAVLAPALPLVAAATGVTSLPSLLITLPSLGVVLFSPITARWMERRGALNALKEGLCLYAVLGVGGVFLSGVWLCFDRLLLGAATALVMASGTWLIGYWYEGRARLVMIARQGMAIELGGVIVLSLSGLLSSIHWYLPFLLYLFAGLCWWWAVKTLPPIKMIERSANGPSAPLPSSMKAVYILATGAMLVFFTAIVQLPVRLPQLGFSTALTGYFLAFISIVAVMVAMLMPRLVVRLGEMQTLSLGFCGFILGHLLFATTTSPLMLWGAAIAIGVGFGCTIPLVNHLTIERVHSQARARALAYLSMAIFLGQFLASATDFISSGADVFGFAALLAVLLCGFSIYQLIKKRLFYWFLK